MYLRGLSLIYAFAYLILLYGIPAFFGVRLPKIRLRSAISIIGIITLFYIVVAICLLIQDDEISNRVLHAVGGGSLMTFIFFLATKDSGTKISKFQFLILAICAATLFGVANEILEFLLQNEFGFKFAKTINDTWLDLISNTVGTIAASLVLVPFIKIKTDRN